MYGCFYGFRVLGSLESIPYVLLSTRVRASRKVQGGVEAEDRGLGFRV